MIHFLLFFFLCCGRLESAILNDRVTIEDYLFDSTPQLRGPSWDLQSIDGSNIRSHRSKELQERASVPQSTSYALIDNHLFQWIFGNATTSFNISVSTCLNLTDIAGPYQFDNGSAKDDATMMDIIDDLGPEVSSEANDRFARRTLSNAQSAYDEMEAFLINKILVKDDSLTHSSTHVRRQFQSNGRVLGTVIKTAFGVAFGLTGVGIANGHNTTYSQLFAGALTSGGLVLVVSIIDIIREEGGLSTIEPQWMKKTAVWTANALISCMRKMVRSAGEAPFNDERRYTQAELDAFLEQLGREDVFSVWDPQSTPGTMSLSGICDEV